ncbi:hypothetical protein JHK82_050029 [Glycine max]|nr:hypothetical protein JHK82_050029 [Glycine max]
MLVKSKDQVWLPKLETISEYKVKFSPSGERNGSSLNRENEIVGELYKCRATRRSSRECCILDGKSPIVESITSLRSDSSSMVHVESRIYNLVSNICE